MERPLRARDIDTEYGRCRGMPDIIPMAKRVLVADHILRSRGESVDIEDGADRDPPKMADDNGAREVPAAPKMANRDRHTVYVIIR